MFGGVGSGTWVSKEKASPDVLDTREEKVPSSWNVLSCTLQAPASPDLPGWISTWRSSLVTEVSKGESESLSEWRRVNTNHCENTIKAKVDSVTWSEFGRIRLIGWWRTRMIAVGVSKWWCYRWQCLFFFVCLYILQIFCNECVLFKKTDLNKTAL